MHAVTLWVVFSFKTTIKVVNVPTKLSARQLHWSTIEKECYAIIWALRKFKSFIFGTPTKIQTDHNPLRYLTETSPKNSKLMRWLLAIQTYPHLSFEFKTGNNNVAANCVSRMVYENDRVHDQDWISPAIECMAFNESYHMYPLSLSNVFCVRMVLREMLCFFGSRRDVITMDDSKRCRLLFRLL